MQTVSSRQQGAGSKAGSSRCGACGGPLRPGRRYCVDCATQLEDDADLFPSDEPSELGIQLEMTPNVLAPPPKGVTSRRAPERPRPRARVASLAERPSVPSGNPSNRSTPAVPSPPADEVSFDLPRRSGFPLKWVVAAGAAASVFALGIALAMSLPGANSEADQAALAPIARAALSVPSVPPAAPVPTTTPAKAVAGKASSHPSQGKKVAHAKKARSRA